MLKTSDRYLLKQLLFPFILALIGFVIFGLLLLIGQISKLFVSRAIQPQALFLLMLYQIPYFLIWAFPIAYLFAILMSMGRMGHDNELVAMQSAGISPRRLLVPIIAIGILLSVADFAISETIAVRANKAFLTLYTEQYFGTGGLAPRIQNNAIFKGTDNKFFYVREQDSLTGHLQDVLIFDSSPLVPDELASPVPRVWTAATAEWTDSEWILYDGEIIAFGQSGKYFSNFVKISHSIGGTIRELSNSYATPRQMSMSELKTQMEFLENSGRQIQSLKVEYHLKLAIPLGCLVFALLGGPLSLMIGPRGRSFALIATVALVLAYQAVLFLSAFLLGNRGDLPPILAAWIPNMFFAALGIILFLNSGALSRNDWMERLKSVFVRS
jgi:lipopolysaccharide export system permease protein